jgi:hypothetical protein
MLMGDGSSLDATKILLLCVLDMAKSTARISLELALIQH